MNKFKVGLFMMMACLAIFITSCENSDTLQPENHDAHEHRLKHDQLEVPSEYASIPTGSRSTTQATVCPIVLIPSGSPALTQQQTQQVKQALENVRLWYQRELPNKDIKWESLKFLNGQKTASHYVTSNNVWAEIPTEIQNAFGWNPWANNSSGNRVALVLGRNLAGWAGGNGNADGRGVAIVGLEALIDPASVSQHWWGTPEYWHGTTIHELGHGLTLPHNNDPQSIMQFHSNYKTRHLNTTEAAQAEQSAVMKTKGARPIGRWSFDELSSGVINDEFGSNDITLYNGASLVNGLIEDAVRFDGVNDVARTGNNACNVSNQVTISAWVKPSSTSGSRTIVNKWYTPDSYGLSIKDNKFRFSIATVSGNWGLVKFVEAPATNNKWQHVVGIYTGVYLRIYVDGRLRGIKRVSGRIQASNRPVSIGGHPSWNQFKGEIDAVTIYNRAAFDAVY